MKLLGRRSLSTFLRILSSVAMYTSILGAVVLAVVLSLIAAFGGDNTTEAFPIGFAIEDSAYDLEPVGGSSATAQITKARGDLLVTREGDTRVPLRFFFIFPVMAAVIFGLSRLRLVFRRFEEDRPFAPENARYLREIGIAVILAELAWSGMAFWTARQLAAEFTATGIVLQPTFDARMPVLLAGLVVLIVAEVFRIGAVMKSDLDTAHDIQISLLPPGEYDADGVSIRARMQPARAVGGDYYDIVPLGDGRLAFVVADVAGKAIPAALLMTLLQGSLRSLLSSGLRGSELVTRLNDYLVANTPGNRLITFFYGELDPASGELRYVNAGHNPPFLHEAAGVRRLASTAVVLGVLDGAPFPEERLELEPGARLLLYTDGISEAANGSDEEFGDERLQRLVEAKPDEEPSGLLERVSAAVAAFCGKAPQADDMTLMVVRRSAPLPD